MEYESEQNVKLLPKLKSRTRDNITHYPYRLSHTRKGKNKKN